MRNILKNVLESRFMKQSVAFVEKVAVKIRSTHPVVQITAFGVCMLLLGSMQPEYAPLFNTGVRLERCFSRKGSAYIELSSETLLPESGVTDSSKAFEIFKKNVCTNFRNVDKIYMYIDGIEVYSENPYAGAEAKK
mgnify:CR=1 FL=1